MFTREFKIKLVFSGIGSIQIFISDCYFFSFVKLRKEREL